MPDGWDFFVSYTQADRTWAEWIAWQLEEDGHRVLVQAWDFVPGSNWTQRMQDGIAQATRTIAVLSPDYLRSVYGGAEWRAAWAADPEGREQKLLVVRVADGDPPGLLAGVVGIDVFGVDDAKARARLRQMVSRAVSGRAKPDRPPPFPATRAIRREARFPGGLPRTWNVPARNPNFTGRAADLAEMARELSTGAAVTVEALHGMGGVGKTTLANEYAHRHATSYEVVWWVAAEEAALVPDQFARLAEHLGLDPDVKPERLPGLVHQALRDVPGWLLVFDNADDVADLRPWLPASLMPAGVAGHVVVTTRRSGFGELGPVIDLDVIDPDDAVALMKTRVPALDDGVAAEIAEELGRLPLALEQAAAYIDRSQMPAREYLDLLRARAHALYARGTTARRDTIATLWEVSLDTLAGENPAAAQLLGICAYLAPEPIPLDLFTRHPDRLPEPLATAAGDVVELNDVVAAIVDYSLAKRTAAGIHLHRLVQCALRARHRRTSTAHVPAPDASPALAIALGLLRADAPAGVMGVPEAWPRWATLLSHVLAATGRVEGTSPGLGPDAAGAGAWLLDRAATYLQVHSRFHEARTLSEQALAIHESVHGPNHPTVAASLNNLATVLQDLGEPATARPLAERALGITESVYGPHHPAVATRLNNLAQVLQDLGEPATARPLAERALTITESVHGPHHPDVAILLNNLAQVLRDLGEPAIARPLAERALTITESVHGPHHLDVAIWLNTLALVLRDLGEPATARPLAERALGIAETFLGTQHPRVAVLRSNLARLSGSDEPTAGAEPGP